MGWARRLARPLGLGCGLGLGLGATTLEAFAGERVVIDSSATRPPLANLVPGAGAGAGEGEGG